MWLHVCRIWIPYNVYNKPNDKCASIHSIVSRFSSLILNKMNDCVQLMVFRIHDCNCAERAVLFGCVFLCAHICMHPVRRLSSVCLHCSVFTQHTILCVWIYLFSVYMHKNNTIELNSLKKVCIELWRCVRVQWSKKRRKTHTKSNWEMSSSMTLTIHQHFCRRAVNEELQLRRRQRSEKKNT